MRVSLTGIIIAQLIGSNTWGLLGGDLGQRRLQIKTYSMAISPSFFSQTNKMGNIINQESKFPPRAWGGGVFIPRPGRGDINFIRGRRGEKREFGKIRIGYRGRKIPSTFMDCKTGRFKAGDCQSHTAVQIYLNSH